MFLNPYCILEWFSDYFSSKLWYSSTCTALIKHFEGCYLYVYDDATGKKWMPGNPVKGNLTCGWGHLCTQQEAIQYSKGMTQKQADALLKQEMDSSCQSVLDMCTNLPTQSQLDGLVSLCFNIGAGALKDGTVMIKFNKGQIQQAADTMLLYDKVKGQVVEGLVRRRKCERDIFLGKTIKDLQKVNWYA